MVLLTHNYICFMFIKTIALSGLAISIGIGTYLIQDSSPASRSTTDQAAPPIAIVDSERPLSIQDGSVSLSASFEHPYILQEEQSEFVHLLVTAEGAEAISSIPRTPLNISVVLDRSGSMESENKLEYAKSAGQLVLDNLTSSDQFSMVAYDDHVKLIQKSGPVSNKEILKQKVSRIRSGGSTNLSGGMMEGYAQVASTKGPQAIDRVLLLSDGLANQGITDLAQLQKIVEGKFSQQGIAISTFGVGADYNEDLMTDLAEYGRGNYHFIESADQIPGIFAEELEGLLSVVAQNTRLEIQFPSDSFEVDKIFGYAADVNGNLLSIAYNDVMAQEEKTVLIRFKRKKNLSTAPEFKIALTYDDVNDNYSRIGSEMDLALEFTSDQELYSSHTDERVQRHIVLFESIDRFEMAAKEVDNGNYDKAKEMIKSNGDYMKREFSKISPDSAMLKQYEMNDVYGKDIEEIESKSHQEVKMMQKWNKSASYKMRKKK